VENPMKCSLILNQSQHINTELDDQRNPKCETTCGLIFNKELSPLRHKTKQHLESNKLKDDNVPEFMKIQLNPIRNKNNTLNNNEENRGGSMSKSIENLSSNSKNHCINTPRVGNNVKANSQNETTSLVKSSSNERLSSFSYSYKNKSEKSNSIEPAKFEKPTKQLTNIAIEDKTLIIDKNAENVILRKKSLPLKDNEKNDHDDDSTPELMKVFARRSLKLKDDNFLTTSVNVNSLQTNNQYQVTIDSDKENHINEQKPHNNNNDNNNNNNKTNSHQMKINRNATSDKTNATAININNNIPMSTKRIAPAQQPTTKTTFNFNQNPLKLTEDHITEKQLKTKAIIIKSSQNAIILNNISKTEPGKELTGNKLTEQMTEASEFKAIHQRRAEWEQRVKEALK